MKIFLLGASGNVGSRALSAFVKHGHSVVAYVRSENKITPAMRGILTGVVVGSATDATAMKKAILTNDCDAVFHAAGSAQMIGTSKTGAYNAMFASVVAAIVDARRERGGAAIRAWLMSGFPVMDSLTPPHLLVDYLPMFPEHRANYTLIKMQDQTDIVWSLFCASMLHNKNEKALIPAPDECSGSKLVAGVDSPPQWRRTLIWVPLMGNVLNILAQANGYAGFVEDAVDFIASDLEKGMQSELANKRVCLKPKGKAA